MSNSLLTKGRHIAAFGMYRERKAVDQMYASSMRKIPLGNVAKNDVRHIEYGRIQCSHGCLQPIKTGPSFFARYINCVVVSITPTKLAGIAHTKNHIDAPSNVAEYRYKGRACDN